MEMPGGIGVEAAPAADPEDVQPELSAELTRVPAVPRTTAAWMGELVLGCFPGKLPGQEPGQKFWPTTWPKHLANFRPKTSKQL